jgi:hypothetical protein
MKPGGSVTPMSPCGESWTSSKKRTSWGGASLTETSKLRTAYIAALQAADRGMIGPLLEFARS